MRPNTDHIAYAPMDHVKKALSLYREVWTGLPFSLDQFEEVRANGGEVGLYYEQDNNYVWVPPSAKQTYERAIAAGERPVFIASMERFSPGKINAYFLTPRTDDISDVIHLANELNESEYRESRAKKTRKK